MPLLPCGSEMDDVRGDDPHADERMRYVQCDACGGTGEFLIPVGPHQCDTDAMPCSICDGYGMECVETRPPTAKEAAQANAELQAMIDRGELPF